MSYDIVKSIKVTDDKRVLVCAASNNVWPRDYSQDEEIKSMSAILREQGREALDVYILEGYENGNLQGGSNKYTRALEVLRHMPEYKNYDWRGDWEGTKDARRDDKAGFQALLKKALNTRLPKGGYIITKDYEGQKVYFAQRKGAGFCKWKRDKDNAKVFKFRQDAENAIGYFSNSGGWTVEHK